MGRTLVFGTGGVMAVTMTLLTIWLAQRADAVLFVGNLAAQRTRGALFESGHSLLVSLIGPAGAGLFTANGLAGLAAILGAVALAIFGTAYGLKSLASVARSRRA
jgi:hypothetical protein